MRVYAPALTIAILLFLPGIVQAQDGQLKLLNSPTILIDQATGTGRTQLILKNDSPKPQVYLTADITGPKASNARFSFTTDQNEKEGVALYQQTIPTGQIHQVFIIAHDVWEVGDLEVDINNDGTLLKKIGVKRYPLGVKFDGPSPDKAEISLVNKEPFSLRLKNEDATLYPLSWKLWIKGVDVCGGKLNLPPTGVGLLNCSPNAAWDNSHIGDLFKPETTEGHVLALYPDSPGQDLRNSTPLKTLPVTASLSFFEPFTRQISGYAAIVLVLILGGLTSLLLSQALPNRLQRLKLEEQVDELAKSTADLSSHVESKLQVLLRLERSQLRDLLRSRKSWSPDFQGIFTAVSEGITKLKSRVALAQQMDVVLRRLASMVPRGVPPQQIDEVEGHVKAAGVLIGKTAPTDKDLEAARSEITRASDLIERLNQPDPTFGQQLAQQALQMKNDIDANFKTKSNAFDRVIAAVPGPDETLNRIPTTTTEISADSYVEVDVATQKMSLIRQYALLVDATTNTDVLNRLRDHEPQLLSYLGTTNWHDLSAARLLVREMKDDVYAERIGEQLTNDNAFIAIDPRIAYHGAPLELCVHFLNSSLNSAAAREEWKCSWNFGDGLEETGWTVSHYFLAPTPAGPRFLNTLFKRPYGRTCLIEARFERQTTGQTATAQGQPLVLNKELQVRSRAETGALKGRSWTEGLKLAAALLIAVFGLVAGAREQLEKLDILPGLIAVFLVGFGADTIKNLLAPKT